MNYQWRKILMRSGILWLTLLLQGVTSLHANAGDIQLVKDRKAQCTIILGKECSNSRVNTRIRRPKVTGSIPSNVLPQAATDLAYYLNEIAQIHEDKFQVRLVKDGERTTSKYRILLGSAAISKYRLEEEARTLPYPAYIYRIMGNDLLIFGSSPKGTANGIYGFLQSELGIRWFGPQELFHVVPKHDTITINNIDKRVVPSFLGRRFLDCILGEQPSYRWAARYMRMNEKIDKDEPFINSSHNLYNIFPPAIYAKKHPEYYPLRNGKRFFDDYQNWTPCLSNPDLVAIATEKVKNAFRADKKMHSFSLGINDTTLFCQCNECQKYKNKDINKSFRHSTDWESNVYYHFVNQVAKAVKKEFPNRYIGCIAYNNVTAPPSFPLEENVFVVIVSDLSEYYDRSYHESEEQLVQAWTKKCKNLGFYYYEGLSKLVPAYFPHLVSKELKKKYKQGFKTLTCEVNPGWPWTGPMAYTSAQLWWNVNLDIDNLLQEYFSKLYGSATEPMKRLYKLFEQIHMRPRNGGFLYEHCKLAQFRPYTAEDLIKMRKYLAQAHSLALETKGNYMPPKNDIAQRVAYVSNGLKVFLNMLEAYVKAKKFEKPLKIDDISALSRLDEIDRVLSILTEHDALYRETIRADKFQSFRYTWDRCIAVRQSWKKFIMSEVSKTLAELYLSNKKHKFDNRIRKRLEKTLNNFNKDSSCRALFLLKTSQTELGPNLISNPGFEKTADSGKYPIGPEWVPANTPGWSIFPAKNKNGFSISTKHKYSGQHSVCFSGILSGYYITTIPNVKAGESYHVSAYAKCLLQQAEAKGTVQLEVRWMNNNKWFKYGSDVFSVKLHKFNQWEELETVVQVPQGASMAVVELYATMPMGEQVFFDDITFQKVGKLKLKLGPQLLANGSFEQVWGQKPYQKCSPSQKNMPCGWGTTPQKKHKGIIDTVKTTPRSGHYAAHMKGTGKKAHFIRSVPLGKSPGTYICEAWVRNLSKSPATRIYMEIWWWGKKGWLFGKVLRTPLKEIETGKWSKIELIAKAPKDARSHMAIFLIAENLGPDDEVMFDDVSVRQIIEN